MFQGPNNEVFNIYYLQSSKPQEAGKRKSRTLIIEYREACKKRIEDREFGPREFEASKSSNKILYSYFIFFFFQV